MSLRTLYYAELHTHAHTDTQRHCQVVIKFSVAYDPPLNLCNFHFMQL